MVRKRKVRKGYVMAATRKLYEGIAESFRIGFRQSDTDNERAAIRHVMINVAVDLRADNPRFNIEKFYAACNKDYPTGV